MGRDALLNVLSQFNQIRVDSERLETYRTELTERVQLENSLRLSVQTRYKFAGKRVERGWAAHALDWDMMDRELPPRTRAFKSISDEMVFFQDKLAVIEDVGLKEAFIEFVEKYLGFLDRVHECVNRLTTEEEANALESEINATFEDCPLMAKKARELREIAKKKNSLLSITERIKTCYRVFDSKKESLRQLKLENEIDIQQIEEYEREFTQIYNQGAKMEQTERLSSLSQMKKSIESYLALRKKEKDFEPVRQFLRGDIQKSPRRRSSGEDALGKRPDAGASEQPAKTTLKKVKEGGLVANGVDQSRLGTQMAEESEPIEDQGQRIVEEGREEATGEERKQEDTAGHEDGPDESIKCEESESCEQESLASLDNSELSDADSECSNQYILKQKQKIRKLKSLVIRKKEEQNDLVNQSDERTSSFLHKKFSLMLLFYKLRVLGLDLETCSKTDVYLNTVKATDEMMKKTSLGKVTECELSRLVIKCEEMKYFSQGYQKFKRLEAMFKSFKSLTESMRVQFRGGLKITQEARTSFLQQADMKSYRTSLKESASGQFSIVLTRKKHSLFTKNSKKEWGNLNNKRKTKLRLGTEPYSGLKQSKRKVKEKLINAIYNQVEVKYCLCREPYELTSMIKFDDCEEWFHKECIKIPKYQMKRIKTKNCPACFFLHQSKCDKFPHFRKRKIPFPRFLTILKTAKVLSSFILDERIDEIFYIKTKLYRLRNDLDKIRGQVSRKLSQGRDLTCMWTSLHNVAALYIYLPVHIESVEKTLLSISRKVLDKLNNGQMKSFQLSKSGLKSETEKPVKSVDHSIKDELSRLDEIENKVVNRPNMAPTERAPAEESSAKMAIAENASSRASLAVVNERTEAERPAIAELGKFEEETSTHKGAEPVQIETEDNRPPGDLSPIALKKGEEEKKQKREEANGQRESQD